MGPADSSQLTKMVNQLCIARVLRASPKGSVRQQNERARSQRVVDVISGRRAKAGRWKIRSDHGARRVRLAPSTGCLGPGAGARLKPQRLGALAAAGRIPINS
jgi:hypothetical protein